MSKMQWTAAATMLMLVVHTGCSGTSRFSRQQYAELETDPFLNADTDSERSGDEFREIRTAGSTTRELPYIEFDKAPDRAKSGNDNAGLREKPREKQSPSSAAIASAAPNYGSSVTDSSTTRQPAASGNEFSEWLEKDREPVAQVSGERADRVRSSSLSARRDIRQADFVFPSEEQSVEIQDPVTAEDRAKKNPFEESDPLSAVSSESPREQAFRPPKFFEYP